MTREEMELLAGLSRVCAEAPAFALAFPDNGLPVVDELEFGFRLAEIAHGILLHARQRGLAVHNEVLMSGHRQIGVGVVINGTGDTAPAEE